MARKNVNEKKEGNQAPDLKVSPEVNQVYMSGATGGFTHHDFRLLIFNEKPIDSKNENVIGLVREIDNELIMSHLAVKELHHWLGESIKEFEDQVGEIKPLEQKD